MFGASEQQPRCVSCDFAVLLFSNSVKIAIILTMTQTNTERSHTKIVQAIAKELNVGGTQVAAAVALLDEGATVPFIARYRKEVTGNLDDTQLRNLEERLLYLRELEERRAVILASIEEQGKLTDELRGAVEAAATKQALEDIYLPYKPKRRTRAQVAREAGLEPLADALFANPVLDPQVEAKKYITDKPAAENGVPDVKAALDGARDILVERFAETAELLAKLRTRMWEQGIVTSKVAKGKESAEAEKFRDYYDYSETIRTIPSHRVLALFRGQALEVLTINLSLGEELEAVVPHPALARVVAGEQLGEDVALAAGFLASYLDRIALQKPVELLLLAPTATEVVELHGAGLGVNDDRVLPARQLNQKARDLGAEQLGSPVDRRRQGQMLAGGGDGIGVSNLGRDGDDVGHEGSPGGSGMWLG